MPKHILAPLVIHNNFVTDVYMEPIADIKFHPHQFHMKPYFIQQIQGNN